MIRVHRMCLWDGRDDLLRKRLRKSLQTASVDAWRLWDVYFCCMWVCWLFQRKCLPWPGAFHRQYVGRGNLDATRQCQIRRGDAPHDAGNSHSELEQLSVVLTLCPAVDSDHPLHHHRVRRCPLTLLQDIHPAPGTGGHRLARHSAHGTHFELRPTECGRQRALRC